jgi:hypothetical protein
MGNAAPETGNLASEIDAIGILRSLERKNRAQHILDTTEKPNLILGIGVGMLGVFFAGYVLHGSIGPDLLRGFLTFLVGAFAGLLYPILRAQRRLKAAIELLRLRE